MWPVVQVAPLQICFSSQTDFLEISDVREEEADEGEGQRPFRYGADNVSRVARLSRSPVQFVSYVHSRQTAVHDDWRYEHADDAAQGPDSDAEADQVSRLAVDVRLHVEWEQRLNNDVESSNPEGQHRSHQVHGENRGLLEVGDHAHPEGAD